MKTYLIADVSVKDPDTFGDYLNLIPEHVEKHEGKYLVKGGSPENIEGVWHPEKIVLIEFPNPINLKQFLEDTEVQQLFSLRHRSTESSLISVIESQ